MTKCLLCYRDIESKSYSAQEYHESCSKKFFGTKVPPILEFAQSDMMALAKKVVQSQRIVTGVQPKLSLSKKKTKDKLVEKFTIVGLWGEYILKPQTDRYKELPEIEDTTMHLATIAKINTVPHCLIRLQSGELAYITKRVDRAKKRKLHMEDMCQVTERVTEHKYNGSHEQIGKAILSYATNPGFDLINFYELVLFCFLTGNNDMHLKNFSLLKNENREYNLSPAYDLVASELVVEGDDEELALNLNGKKKKLTKKNFEAAMKTNGINEKAIDNVFLKFKNIKKDWFTLIDSSFLSKQMKNDYKELIELKRDKIYG